MDHVAGSLHVLLAEKVMRIWFNIIYLKLNQFERIAWWYLSVMEYVLESILESILKYLLEIVLLKKY